MNSLIGGSVIQWLTITLKPNPDTIPIY